MSAKILLVEDDIFLRDGIKEALKKEGYSVFTAEDCKTGKAEFVKENPDLIKRMAKEGHIIGNHTVNHPSLPSVKDIELLKNELFELDRLVYGICGEKSVFLRPPKGEYSEKTLAITKDLGYTNVFWSQAYVDWNDKVTEEQAFSKITSDIHPGCVLLLHAVSKGNADALGDVIDYARKEGYTFKNLKEFIS